MQPEFGGKALVYRSLWVKSFQGSLIRWSRVVSPVGRNWTTTENQEAQGARVFLIVLTSKLEKLLTISNLYPGPLFVAKFVPDFRINLHHCVSPWKERWTIFRYALSMPVHDAHARLWQRIWLTTEPTRSSSLASQQRQSWQSFHNEQQGVRSLWPFP